MNIFMIGCESSHAAHFAKALSELNSDKIIISDLWAKDGTFYLSAVQDFYPEVRIVEDVTAAIKRCDAVIITLRRASEHFRFASLAIKHKKPVFVDKPFTDTVESAQKLIELSDKHKIHISGGSTFCFLTEFLENLSAIQNAKNVKISFCADPDSEYEGYRYYGSHLTDLYSAFSESLPQDLAVARRGDEVGISFSHNSQNIRFETNNVQSLLLISFANRVLELSQTECYRAGMYNFVNIIEGKKPGDSERLLRSVKLMSLIEENL